MNETVVDASFLVKLAIAEPDSDKVRTWFTSLPPSQDLVAPTLFFYETARALEKDGQTGNVHDRLVAGVALIEPTPSIWAFTDSVTFYDAAYLHLAKERDASLATSDEKLRSAAKKHGIRLEPMFAGKRSPSPKENG